MRTATLAVLMAAIISGEAFGQVFKRRPAAPAPARPATEVPAQQPAPEPAAEAPRAEERKVELPKVELPKAEAPKAPSDKPKDGRLEPSPTPVIRRTNKRVVAPGLGD